MANEVQALLAVLADGTRRTLVEALRDGPLSVGELAERVPVSRSAVSQHLQVLKAAGLVADEADGTRRHYRLEGAALGALRAWVDGLWSGALGAFAGEVAARKPKAPPKAQPKAQPKARKTR